MLSQPPSRALLRQQWQQRRQVGQRAVVAEITHCPLTPVGINIACRRHWTFCAASSIQSNRKISKEKYLKDVKV